MTDHLATGMKRMIRTVARSASLSDRLGETREPVWRETVDSATYGESRARVAHAVETFRIYDNTGILPETENR